MRMLLRAFFAFYFMYRVTDTATGSVLERGMKHNFETKQECLQVQHAWFMWMSTPRLDPRTKRPLAPDSVEMSDCEPGRLDKMPR